MSTNEKIKDFFGTIWGLVVLIAWVPLGLLGLWIERTFGAKSLYIYLALLAAFVTERVVTIRKNMRIIRQGEPQLPRESSSKF